MYQDLFSYSFVRKTSDSLPLILPTAFGAPAPATGSLFGQPAPASTFWAPNQSPFGAAPAPGGELQDCCCVVFEDRSLTLLI